MQSISVNDEVALLEQPLVRVVALKFPWYNIRGLMVRTAQLVFGCNRFRKYSHIVVLIDNPHDEDTLILDTHNNLFVPCSFRSKEPLNALLQRYPSCTERIIIQLHKPDLSAKLWHKHCTRTWRYPLIRLGIKRGITCTYNVELLLGLEPQGRSVSEVMRLITHRFVNFLAGDK
jgi:hypothetical protein